MTYDVGSQLKREIFGLVKTGGMLLGGLAILAAVSALFANPLQVFFRLIAVASMAMLILSIVTMVLTFRKAKAIEPVALLLSLAVSVIGTLVSLWFGGRPPPLSISLAACLAGALIGVGWSLTTLLFIDNNQIRGRGTAWHLVIWGLTFAINQIGAVVFGHTPSAMTLLMLAGAGLTVGNTLGLLVRVRRVAALIPAMAVPAASQQAHGGTGR
ncbi:hypothetical protein KMZ93_10560 [Bradyrhizobium sediminis]|uniref:Uncharacterized protein n=1 Tax=Bradyrhizobium sediminis TaxID=2840469 RepID=A0A975P1C9_9BRAD|nr:hypothetical protein [Bradyrhizobium sediminis]QWG25278.1 hypothetical protein KMZ93_10560 [Bradyrhizobium sediminis]